MNDETFLVPSILDVREKPFNAIEKIYIVSENSSSMPRSLAGLRTEFLLVVKSVPMICERMFLATRNSVVDSIADHWLTRFKGDGYCELRLTGSESISECNIRETESLESRRSHGANLSIIHRSTGRLWIFRNEEPIRLDAPADMVFTRKQVEVIEAFFRNKVPGAVPDADRSALVLINREFRRLVHDRVAGLFQNRQFLCDIVWCE